MNADMPLTSFDAWKQALTPEFVADGKFIILSCGDCPARGKTCGKRDSTCRGNFLNWARSKFESEEVLSNAKVKNRQRRQPDGCEMV